MDRAARATVPASVRKSCGGKGWALLAAHVRSTHVHLVVAGREKPEMLMGYLKRHASRELNRLDGVRQKRWTRHGSTRWLWEEDNVERAIDYVVNRQGKPMALYECVGHWMEVLDRTPSGSPE